MKKITLFLLLFSISMSAQLHDRFPFNDSGKIVYTETINTQSSRNDLYLKGKEFIINNFKLPNRAIEMDSKEDGVIIGKSYNALTIKTSGIFIIVKLHFNLKLEFKDNRYRYEIYSLNYETAGGSFTAEFLYSKEKEVEYVKAKDGAKEIANQYRDQTISAINDLIQNLKSEMELKKSEW